MKNFLVFSVFCPCSQPLLCCAHCHWNTAQEACKPHHLTGMVSSPVISRNLTSLIHGWSEPGARLRGQIMFAVIVKAGNLVCKGLWNSYTEQLAGTSWGTCQSQIPLRPQTPQVTGWEWGLSGNWVSMECNPTNTLPFWGKHSVALNRRIALFTKSQQ